MKKIAADYGEERKEKESKKDSKIFFILCENFSWIDCLEPWYLILSITW